MDEAVSNSVSKAPGNSEVQIGERSSRQHAVMPGVLLLPCKVFTFLLLYSDFFVCVRARSVFSQTKNETERTLSQPRRQQMLWVGQGYGAGWWWWWWVLEHAEKMSLGWSERASCPRAIFIPGTITRLCLPGLFFFKHLGYYPVNVTRV